MEHHLPLLISSRIVYLSEWVIIVNEGRKKGEEDCPNKTPNLLNYKVFR